MKQIILVLLLPVLAVGIANAQTEKYFIKTNNSRVDIHPTKVGVLGISFNLTNEELDYYDTKGNEQEIHQSEVKEMFIGSDYYTLLPITKRYNRLLKVIATNSDHILSIYEQYSGSGSPPAIYLFVHNKQTREMEEDKIRYYNLETNYEDILPTIKKYFGNCSELLDGMVKNSKKQQNEKKLKRNGPFENISNLVCPK